MKVKAVCISERKGEIRALLCRYIIGFFPDDVPAIKQVTVLRKERMRGAIRRDIRLAFDTDPLAYFDFELMQPEGPGPFPVFLTQATHRRVALVGLSRAYLACVYPGGESGSSTHALVGR